MASIQAMRLAYEQERYQEVWAQYQVCFLSGEATAESHYLAGRAALQRNDLFEAKSTMLRALGAQPSGALLGQIRVALAEVERRIGEVDEAVAHLQTFLDDPGEHADLGALWHGAAQYNLALSLRQAGRLEESRAAYRQAILIFRRERLREPLWRALLNLAWAACLQGDADEAGSALEEAEQLCQGEEARWRQRLGRSFLLATVGESSKAMDLCGAIVRADSPIPPDVRSYACWIAGREALRQGRFEVALAMAEQALLYAAHVGKDRRVLQDAADLFQAVRARLAPTGMVDSHSSPLAGVRDT